MLATTASSRGKQSENTFPAFTLAKHYRNSKCTHTGTLNIFKDWLWTSLFYVLFKFISWQRTGLSQLDLNRPRVSRYYPFCCLDISLSHRMQCKKSLHFLMISRNIFENLPIWWCDSLVCPMSGFKVMIIRISVQTLLIFLNIFLIKLFKSECLSNYKECFSWKHFEL